MKEARIRGMKDLPSTHLLGAGTAMCAGCGGLEAVHEIYDLVGGKTVFVNAAGCMTLLATYPFTPFRGGWLFAAGADFYGSFLWFTDGTPAGTRQVARVAAASWFGVAGSRAFFVSSDNSTGSELWITDGTAAGTRLVLDIEPGANSSLPQHFTVVGGKVFFSASQATDCSATFLNCASPKTCGWRRIILSEIASATAAKSKTPCSSPMRAWKTTCSSRSPSSSLRSERSPRSTASATS